MAVAPERTDHAPTRSTSPAPAPHLVVRGLGVERGGRWLFRDLTWEVPRGSFVVVTGPSGAGKSSLLACLAGLLAPSAGEVAYRRAAGRCLPAAMRSRIGLVFQSLMLTPNASVLSNVLCGRLGRHPAWRTALGFPLRDRQEALDRLAALELAHYAQRPVGTLSGGEQQRVAVARALFQEPDVLLADEPVSSLDPALAGRVLGLLRDAADARRCTVVCVLHDVAPVAGVADFVVRLDPGDPGAGRLTAVAR